MDSSARRSTTVSTSSFQMWTGLPSYALEGCLMARCDILRTGGELHSQNSNISRTYSSYLIEYFSEARTLEHAIILCVASYRRNDAGGTTPSLAAECSVPLSKCGRLRHALYYCERRRQRVPNYVPHVLCGCGRKCKYCESLIFI